MSVKFEITPKPLSIDSLRNLLDGQRAISLSAEAAEKISNCRKWLETKLKDSTEPIYGVTTGFGSLCNVQISPAQSDELQINLVRSHAVGTGAAIPAEIVRLMMLLKAQSLSYGHSGARLETVNQLIALFNKDLLPVIPEQGSLGASGDLCPLAHMTLGLVGEGKIHTSEGVKAAAEVLSAHQIKPIKLRAKEGLALLNGTQFMGAYAVWCQLEAERLCALADLVAALSIDARLARPEPFDPLTHQLRNHAGQLESATRIMDWLQGSELMELPKVQVQDNYSFRCTPQVHGATFDSLRHSRMVINNEISAVTDNPLIFPEHDKVISGGNFHGQPLALILDFMAIAVSELASIAERRIYRLLAGEGGLPPFLVSESGLQSGLMITQYSAAALVSQNKQLATPSSVDSIPSCNEQEDHVSMGANGATKLYRVVKNTEQVLSIAFMTAVQALDIRTSQTGKATSNKLSEIIAKYRAQVPFLDQDRHLKEDMDKTVAFLQTQAALYHS